MKKIIVITLICFHQQSFAQELKSAFLFDLEVATNPPQAVGHRRVPDLYHKVATFSVGSGRCARGRSNLSDRSDQFVGFSEKPGEYRCPVVNIVNLVFDDILAFICQQIEFKHPRLDPECRVCGICLGQNGLGRLDEGFA